jgi:hypothetical protein
MREGVLEKKYIKSGFKRLLGLFAKIPCLLSKHML